MFLKILIAFVLFLWLYLLWSRRRFYRAAWQLRGPIGWPLIGVGLDMLNPDTFLQFLEAKLLEYGSPFISWLGIDCFLYISDPETIETVFNSSQCTEKGRFYRFVSDAIGDGLFTSKSPRWNKHRRLINPAFSLQTVHSFLPIFNNEANNFLAVLAKQEQPFEIYQVFKKSALEIACQTTMGKRMNFQQERSKAIFDAYNGITEVCIQRMLQPWLHLNFVYRWTQLFLRQRSVVNVLNTFIECLLKSNNTQTILDCSSEGTKYDIDHVNGVHVDVNDDDDDVADIDCSATAEEGVRLKSKPIFVEQVRQHVEHGQLSWQDVRDEANVIIAAAFETTSTALYFTVLCLAMHTEYQKKLQHELLELFPNSASEVTNEQLARMTYTEMVINEAMRLLAPVPMVLRQATTDFQLTNGITVPQGTQIGIDIYNMQRSTRYWGPLAQCYNPEAHFGMHAVRRHPFAFVPFTKGLRMCIGHRYAMILMKVYIAKIFRKFHITTDLRLNELSVKGTISLKLHEYPLCSVQAITD